MTDATPLPAPLPLSEDLEVLLTVKYAPPTFPNNSTQLQPHIACEGVESL